MPATFSNRFDMELNDVARIIFHDQRANTTSPPADSPSVVMTLDNFKQLIELGQKLVVEHEANQQKMKN